MKQLMTKWGDLLEDDHILQEYPRPNLVRDSYLNLNGRWQYAISDWEQVETYEGEIRVPFSPECALSGVGRILQPGQFLHYRRTFSLPEGFIKKRVLLHFEGVDQVCRVYVNERFVGEHTGGYLPFTFDITPFLVAGENGLQVTVQDWTELRPYGRGKQKLKRKGKYSAIFYTPQSGIWKTVWLESVENAYISRVKLTPDFDGKQVFLQVFAGGEEDLLQRTATVRVIGQGEVVAEGTVPIGEKTALFLGEFTSWSPENPFLYDVEIRYGEDLVKSYFGMRKVSVSRDSRGILRFFLNNRPYFFNGLLDQGYWPDGLMTPPSDDALVYDIQKTKEMGYNTIRKHIKIESRRFYYHCDRLGVLVWQDMPNGGGEYCLPFVMYLPNLLPALSRHIPDRHYGLFRRKNEQGRAWYRRELKEMVETLYSFPSIVTWVPFNEGWGQFDARRIAKWLEKLDPTRLINHACGWFDQGGGHVYSMHNYFRKLKVRPQPDRVVALTEFGGYACQVPGHMMQEETFGYRTYDTREELTRRYEKLFSEQIYPNMEKGLSAAIYTQTSDIEKEINGVMTYDRAEAKMEPERLRQVHERLYEMFKECVEDEK